MFESLSGRCARFDQCKHIVSCSVANSRSCLEGCFQFWCTTEGCGLWYACNVQSCQVSLPTAAAQGPLLRPRRARLQQRSDEARKYLDADALTTCNDQAWQMQAHSALYMQAEQGTARLVLGVDGGATKTVCVAEDTATQECVGVGRGGGCNKCAWRGQPSRSCTAD